MLLLMLLLLEISAPSNPRASPPSSRMDSAEVRERLTIFRSDDFLGEGEVSSARGGPGVPSGFAFSFASARAFTFAFIRATALTVARK
jgi:hypothetical protein